MYYILTQFNHFVLTAGLMLTTSIYFQKVQKPAESDADIEALRSAALLTKKPAPAENRPSTPQVSISITIQSIRPPEWVGN